MISLIVSVGTLIITILYAVYGQVIPPGWERKPFLKLVLLVETVATIIVIFENYLLDDNPNLIFKPNPGERVLSEERILNVEGKVENYQVNFDIPARVLEMDEIEEVLNNAKMEIDATFKGENLDNDHIERNVVMNSSYQNGLVMAEWRLDNYSYIYTNGELANADLKEPVVCNADVYLECENQIEMYTFSFVICPPSKTPLEAFIQGIKEQLFLDIEQTKTKESVTLPQEYDGYDLVWKKKKTNNGILVLVLGMIVIFGLGFGRIADERKKESERLNLLKLGYSDMLSNLSLLLGAGMSLRKAWEKMVMSSRDRAGPYSPLYKEMEIALHQMQTGKSEVLAIEEFGKRTRLPCYRKISGILINYITKGSRDISVQLNNEVVLAFEERKSYAKIAGELAGTKLLLPMLMLLGVALVIIIVPALMSFSF